MTGRQSFYGIKRVLVYGTALAGSFVLSNPTFAQVADATTIADPSRAAERFLDTPQLSDLSQSVEVTAPIIQAAPEGAENIKFELKQLMIEGVSAYDSAALDPLYRDKLGTTVTLADIYGISAALTNKYRNEGYILTQVFVPPQTIEGGIVKLQVVEGVIDQVVVQGVENPREVEQIQAYADQLREGGALNAQNLERYLLLINDLPGVTARSILSPSKTTVGASDVTIIVERDNYEAELGFDNYGSRYLGAYEGLASGATNSVFHRNERIDGRFVISGDKDRIDELLFGALSYEEPINKYGTKVHLLGSITATEPGYDLDPFDVHGLSKFASISLTHPFIRSRTTNLFARTSFDWRNVDSRNDLELTRQDRIRSLRAGVTYQFMDTLLGVGVNAADLEISKGINIFGSSDEDSPNPTRAEGNPQYTKAKLDLQRLQRITPQLNLLIAGQGQWAASPLLSSEEFGVGGVFFGRGYDSSEIVGDDGIAGKLELQWNKPKEIKYINNYQLFVHLDSGKVWNQDATTSAEKQDSLTSTGFGVRADITEKTKAGVGVSFPLTRERDTTGDRDPRYYFNVSHKF